MSCPKTQHLMQEYFSDDLAPLLREELEKHLQGCAHCRLEMTSLLESREALDGWQEQRVPHWDRGLDLYTREHRVPRSASVFWSAWQWLPTVASFAMLCVLLLNLTVTSSGRGFTISFSEATSEVANVQSFINSTLVSFEESQRSEMEQAIARMEDRQDSNYLRMMQAMMEQSQQTTAENLEQIYAYFEQQRILDLEDMRLGYQQLVDSDYETIRSLQQLANFVSYQDDPR